MNLIEAKPENSRFNDEQWQAIQTFGSNLLVAASAGSGKTTVLVERIMTHLRKNRTTIKELLVVTFTEAAAREMKDRLEKQIKVEFNNTTHPEDRQRLLAEIQALPQAHIQTLHSFCLQVVQQFFYVIDFNPNFDLMVSEIEKDLLYKETWQDLCQAIAQGQSDRLTAATYQSLLKVFGSHRSDVPLFSMVLSLYHFAVSLPDPQAWIAHMDYHQSHFDRFFESDLFKSAIAHRLQAVLKAAISQYQGLLDQTVGLSASLRGKFYDFLTAEQASLQPLSQALEQSDFTAFMALVEILKFNRWPSASKKSDENDLEIIAILKPKRDAIKKMVNDNLAIYKRFSMATFTQIEDRVQGRVQALSHLVQAFMTTLQAKKRERNVIDYNDLEHLTLQILTKTEEANEQTTGPETDQALGQGQNGVAALYYQTLFKEVLVDEYQDINEIQAAILSHLSHEQIEGDPGNLFMVGDVKQSIYGFRNAEPGLFLKKYQAYGQGQGGQRIILDTNYRSRDEVLQFTNYLFERLMDPEFGQMVYARDEALKTGNHTFLPEGPHPDYNVHLLLHDKKEAIEAVENNGFESVEDEDQGSEDALEAQAYIVGRQIHTLMTQGYQIYDKDLKAQRPLAYRDIVILSATRKPFLQFQQIFDSLHIPTMAQKVENYFQRQEVQLLIALLKLIDNPHQDLPLVAILRSYFVGLDDDELALIRIHHKNPDFYQAVLAYIQDRENAGKNNINQQLFNKLDNFVTNLQRWKRISLNQNVVKLIWTIYQETHYIAFISGLTNADQRLANLHGFYQQAQEFEKTTYKGLYAFINYIEEMLRANRDLSEPPVLEASANYVRLMTVHASKGLEFPLVFLVNTEKKFNLKDAQSPYVLLREEGMALAYYDNNHFLKYPSLVRQAMKVLKEDQIKAEEMRKLYVALTRCEQTLYIVGSISNRNSWANGGEAMVANTSESSLVMNTYLRQKGNSWLDWINGAVAFLHQPHHPESVSSFKADQLTLEFVSQPFPMVPQGGPEGFDEGEAPHKEASAVSALASSAMPLTALKEIPSDRLQAVWDAAYNYTIATVTASYQSVSELKRLYELPQNPKATAFEGQPASLNRKERKRASEAEAPVGIRYTEDTFADPAFLQDRTALTSVEKGTFTHQLLRYLDYKAFANQPLDAYPETMRAEVDRMVVQSLLTPTQVEAIKVEAILALLTSELGQLFIRHSGMVIRETPFSAVIPAEKLYRQALDNQGLRELTGKDILINGVIDLYLDTPDCLYLIDFKTDRYRPNSPLTPPQQVEEIVRKYRFQMSLYQLALENIYPDKKMAAYLYLLDFDLSVPVEIIRL